jgi:dephospho-CoA kinase
MSTEDDAVMVLCRTVEERGIAIAQLEAANDLLQAEVRLLRAELAESMRSDSEARAQLERMVDRLIRLEGGN